MIHKISHSFSFYLSKNGGIPEKQQIYAYGIECILNELISDFLLLLCAIIMHQVVPMLIWCVSFTLIRIHLGGYHAVTHRRCIIYGTVIGICSVNINFIWKLLHPLGTIIITAVTLLLSIRYAPIIHKNHPVSSQLKLEAKKKAVFFTLSEGIIGISLLNDFPNVVSPIITGMLTASLMGIVELGIRKLSDFSSVYNESQEIIRKDTVRSSIHLLSKK